MRAWRRGPERPRAAALGARRVPPPARSRDWPLCGACAGLCLAAGELAALAALGASPPNDVALSMGALDAIGVSLLCLPVALGFHLADRRTNHSALVAGVVGPLLAVAELPGLLSGEFVASLDGFGIAALVGYLAARVGGRIERAGVPIPGPPIWLAVALLSTSARMLEARRESSVGLAPLLGLVAAIVACAFAAAWLAARASRREALAPWPWSRLFVALSLGVAAIAVAPSTLPWLLMDPPGRASMPVSPNILVVDLGSLGADPGAHVPSLEALASTGVLFRRFLPGPDPRPGAWLTKTDGPGLLRALEARGYRIEALGPVGSRPPGFARGPDPERFLHATVGGSLLASLGDRAITASPAARLSAEAHRRIAHARALEPERPGFLFLDLSELALDPAALDTTLAEILELISELGLDSDGRTAVVWREAVDGGPVRGRAIIRLGPGSGADRGRVVDLPILASELSAAIADPATLDVLVGTGDGAR